MPEVNFFTDSHFTRFNAAFDSCMKELQSTGKRQVKNAEPSSAEHEDALWEKGLLSPSVDQHNCVLCWYFLPFVVGRNMVNYDTDLHRSVWLTYLVLFRTWYIKSMCRKPTKVAYSTGNVVEKKLFIMPILLILSAVWCICTSYIFSNAQLTALMVSFIWSH